MRTNVPPGTGATIHQRHPLSPDLLHPGALRVVNRLKKQGYETYFAGGCVRDFLLDVRPSDLDIATAASRAKVDAMFFHKRTGHRAPPERTLPSADEVVVDIISFGAPPWADLTAWRNQRKREQSSLAEAFIKSFDYTINALYYDPADNVIIDFVNGVKDVRKRTLRLVRPTEFRLDVISVLRGVVQCSKKDLRIDDATWEAMCEWASIGDLRLKQPARIFPHMVKTLGSGVAARCFEILDRMGALRLFWGRSTIPNSELARIRRFLAALDRVSAPGIAISVLFATLFFHPIELALGRIGAMPSKRSRSREEWAAHERALSDRIELKLRPLAEPFAIPRTIYKETHKILLAVRLRREGRGARQWRGTSEDPWRKEAALLLRIVAHVDR